MRNHRGLDSEVIHLSVLPDPFLLVRDGKGQILDGFCLKFPREEPPVGPPRERQLHCASCAGTARFIPGESLGTGTSQPPDAPPPLTRAPWSFPPVRPGCPGTSLSLHVLDFKKFHTQDWVRQASTRVTLSSQGMRRWGTFHH